MMIDLLVNQKRGKEESRREGKGGEESRGEGRRRVLR